uniref:BACK domain-containing protein n=1 Tax=Toxocara canis TaxID=6265 RepID=A0A183V3S0_TOXCA
LGLASAAMALTSNKTILIRSHKNNFIVDVDIFAKYSDLIKKLRPSKKLPPSLDLSNYAVTAVSTLCDFVNDTGRANARITTFILGDLIELSRVLQIGLLRQKIEQFVVESAENNPRFVMHALTMLSNDKELIESQLGQKVVDIAVVDFTRICNTSPFNEIPADIIVRLLDRCDLPVDSEYQVAEVAVRWLASKPERVRHAYRVLRCIRVSNLNAEQRAQLEALIAAMPQYSTTIAAFAHYAFNSTNALRVCTLAEHALPCFKRCARQVAQSEFTCVFSFPRTFSVNSITKAVERSTKCAQVETNGGTLVERSVVSVAPQRKTTRAERMATYEKEAKKRGQSRRHFAVAPGVSSHKPKVSVVKKEVKKTQNNAHGGTSSTKCANENLKTSESKAVPSFKGEPKKSRKDVPRASPTSTSDEDDDGSSERKGGSSAAKSVDKKTAQSRKAAGISPATHTTASDCRARTINDISVQDKQLQPDERLLDA